MSALLKAGDRVRVTAANRTQGYHPGDKGTILRASTLVTTGAPYYTVAMDKDGPDATGVVFEGAEIEADTGS
jgi:hypothetical protein